jgi:hypothetical protein
MSTRGAIGRLASEQPLRFSSVYHHWDSYPSGLGKTLWDLYHGHFKRDLEAMLRVLIDEHPAGWSSLNSADFTARPGFHDPLEGGAQQPVGPACYCHGERQEEPWEVNERNAAGSGCEYVYAFSDDRAMRVLSSYQRSGRKMVGMFGMGDQSAEWVVVATVDLDGPEPDWEETDSLAKQPRRLASDTARDSTAGSAKEAAGK